MTWGANTDHGWSDRNFAALGHLHNGDTLEHDGVDSDGGVFPYDTTDEIRFNNPVVVGGTLDSTATLDIIPSGLRDVKFYDESGVGVSQSCTWYGRDAGLLKFMSLRVGLNSIADFGGNVNSFNYNNDIILTKDQDSLTEISISNDNSGTDIRHTSLSLYDGATEKAFVEYWNNSEEMHVGTFGVDSVLFLESGDGVVGMLIDEMQMVGMGTVIPDTKLDIQEESDISFASVSGNIAATSIDPTLRIYNTENDSAVSDRAAGINLSAHSGTNSSGQVGLYCVSEGDRQGTLVLATRGGAASASVTEKARLEYDGKFGIGTIPTILLDVNAKCGMTTEGGIAIKLTNKTGANSVKGQLVKASPTTNDSVILTGANDDEGIGVFYESGVANDEEAWIVTGGIADVAMNDNLSATRGDWIGSGEAGYCISQASPPAAPAHFEEQGHCLQTVAAGGGGTHILARCVLHQN